MDNKIGAGGASAIAGALRAHPGVLRDVEGIHLAAADPDLPLELKRADNERILDFYRDLLRSPQVVSRRCRVMLLGTGGVGKTTLANRLQVATGALCDAAVSVTHGTLQRTCLRAADASQWKKFDSF